MMVEVKKALYVLPTEVHVIGIAASHELERLQTLVVGRIQAAPARGQFEHSISAFCNEEGKIKGLPVNPCATELLGIGEWDVIAGPAVILGPVDEEGETMAVDEALEARVKAWCEANGYGWVGP